MALSVVLGAIMTILDTTIVNVAVNMLGSDLHTSLSTIQWVITGYMLALSMTIPITGWAIERFGAKTIWITSLALFIAGSAAVRRSPGRRPASSRSGCCRASAAGCSCRSGRPCSPARPARIAWAGRWP